MAQTQSEWGKDGALHIQYKEASKAVGAATYQAQKNFEENLAATRRTLNVCMPTSTKKKRVDCGITAIRVGEKTMTEKQVIAEALNPQFDSVFTKDEDDEIPLLQPRVPLINFIASINIREETVHKLLRKLQPEKSMGVDNVHPLILKSCAVALTRPPNKNLQGIPKGGHFTTTLARSERYTHFQERKQSRGG